MTDQAAVTQILSAVSAKTADLAATHPPDAIPLAEATAAIYEEAIGQFEAIAPPPQPMACAKGCYHCCRLRVMTTRANAAQIADFIRRSWTAEVQNEFLARARSAVAYHATAESTAPMVKAPLCPFVVDRACSIHSVRPTACRALNSYTLGACLRAVTGRPDQVGAIPGWAPAQAVQRAIVSGLTQGHQAAGHGETRVELVPGVLERLLNI